MTNFGYFRITGVQSFFDESTFFDKHRDLAGVVDFLEVDDHQFVTCDNEASARFFLKEHPEIIDFRSAKFGKRHYRQADLIKFRVTHEMTNAILQDLVDRGIEFTWSTISAYPTTCDLLVNIPDEIDLAYAMMVWK